MAKKKSAKKLSMYANLTSKHRINKDSRSRKKAERLAQLPKHPVKRLLYRMHPKRMAKYWFSREGLIMALKLGGVAILLMIILAGSVFAYFRKDIDQIKPSELAKNVHSTVTTYYDRNGVKLWEDRGGGNYRLTVPSEDISQDMKDATVAVEDKDFYNHNGVSFSGIGRAAIHNLTSSSTQGGSTLTQQLVKQVFFSEEAHDRSLGGIPRKIKEMILSVEVERMYDKDTILTMYLNQSPYGGPRSGIESAAQAYFEKPASKLNLAESALLAGIPNQPGLYNPYNIDGHDALINRQHHVLGNMLSQGYIDQKEYDAAIAVPIIDKIKPVTNQYSDIKAPHFLLDVVQNELVSKLGDTVVGKGGLHVKTTLDWRIQKKTDQAIKGIFNGSVGTNFCNGINCSQFAGFSNGAATVEDVKTGQIVALVGSRDFMYKGFGQDDAATAYIQPGSTIKPLVYASLFRDRGGDVQNYGSGSILGDDHGIDKIYGAPLKNADGTYMGDISIRKGLALSRNVPAVKAMYISGIDETLQTIHDLGNSAYCTKEQYPGLAGAIGGCGTTMVDHVSSFASLARMGVYKPQTSILEVSNSSGDVLYKFNDDKGKQVIDPQQAYIVSDILADDNARSGLYGRGTLLIPGVKNALKTGTSDKGGQAKDIWSVSYTPSLAMAVWLGNPDTSTLTNGRSNIPVSVIQEVMGYAHKEVYAKEKKWSPDNGGSWFKQPQGIQHIGGELFPSWYNKSQGISLDKMTFDRVSKKKATDCTPDAARIELTVRKFKDPITKQDRTVAENKDYDTTEDDDFHKCNDRKPEVTSISANESGNSGSYTIKISVNWGTNGQRSVNASVGGTTLQVRGSGGSYTAEYEPPAGESTQRVNVTVTDRGYYTDEGSTSITFNKND